MRLYRRTLLLGFVLLAWAALANLVLHYRSVQSIARTGQWVGHTNQVRAEIYALGSGLKDAQRGVSSFIASRQPESLQPYHAALGSAGEHFDRLVSLTSDNPRQQGRLKQVKAELTHLLDPPQREVSSAEGSHVEAASPLVSFGKVNAQIDAISPILTEMLEEENRLLTERQAASDRSVGFAITSLVVASAYTLLFLGGIFVIIFRQARERRAAEEALVRLGRKLIKAHEEERARIASELNDDLNPRIAGLAAELEQWDQPALERVADFRSLVRQASHRLSEIEHDIESLSQRLHSTKLEYQGIAAAAGSFCKELSEQMKIEIDFSHTELPQSVTKEISLCLFRVLQESLQNAVKHSGVRRFRVELSEALGEIYLSVSDAGIGFNPTDAISSQGLGLIGMRERLQSVNGQFSIKSKAGYGTTVRARVPIAAASGVSRAG